MSDNVISPEIIGWTVLSLTAILYLVEKAKKVFWPNVPADQEFVRRVDFQELKSTMNSYVTKIELGRLEQQLSALTTEHKELKDYTHNRIYDLGEKVHDIRLKIETMHLDISKSIEAAALKVVERITVLEANQKK